MQKRSTAGRRTNVLFCLFILGLVTALIWLPSRFRSEANVKSAATIDIDEQFPNYDIRSDKNEAAFDFITKARIPVGRSAAAISDMRSDFVAGENALRTSVPTLKVEYNLDIRIPEVLAPDVQQGSHLMSAPSREKRSEILRDFVKQNNALVGVSDAQADQLEVVSDYTNPNGILSFAQLNQRIDGIPVFRGEVKAGFTKKGEIIRVINNLAPGLDYLALQKDFADPTDAVKAAFDHVERKITDVDTERNAKESTDLRAKFGTGDWATYAEKTYFPTEVGVAVPSWRVMIWGEKATFMLLIDAQTGTLLWRQKMSFNQTESATYGVYANSTSMFGMLNSAAPLVNTTDPTLGTQGVLGSRTSVTLVGNEAPNTFNNTGWLPNGVTVTDGNNVEAGLDRNATAGVDAPISSPTRSFIYTFNPITDEPLTTDYQNGSVTSLFYAVNRYHDLVYNLGFTEQSFNFQGSNFGRGGVEGDRISAQAQDKEGFNNANFGSIPGFVIGPDGDRGAMQMFLWNGPTPDRDGAFDFDIIVHELTHGTSARLHGNASGLSNNMAGGMGEGWGDFFGHVMLSNPSEDINGTFVTGGFATFLLTGPTFNTNYYYGIRRFPKAPIAFLGPNGKPHNPFTFRYLNSDCNTLIGTPTSNPPPNSAFPRGPVGSSQCDQVHNGGEIWSSTLWEVRTRYVQTEGFTAGNQKVLQVVTDGMKLAPLGPTMLQERDAILAAVQNSYPTLVAKTWEGFAARGMGFGARVNTISPAAVTESFGLPNAIFTDPFSVSDATGDGDGFPEPTETVGLSIAVTNTTGATSNNVTVSVSGGTPVSYGNIANGATVTNVIPYTVPAGAVCGALHDVSIVVASAAATNPAVVKSFRLGAPVGGAPATFSNTAVINMPAGQPTATVGVSDPYPSPITVSGLSGQKIIRVNFNNFHHEFEDDLDMLLVGPGGQQFVIASDVGGATEQLTPISFSIADNGATVLPDATAFINGTTYRPSNVTAGDAFAAPAPTTAVQNPAPAGSATFESVFGTNGAAMNGTWSLYIVDDASGDPGAIDSGWSLTFESNEYTCTVGAATSFSVSGRVVDAAGTGVPNATVTLNNGTNVLKTTTSSFGYYSFPIVPIGAAYTGSVTTKRYTFPTQVITLTGNVSNLNFTANP